MSDTGDTGDTGDSAAEHGLQTTARDPDELRLELEGWLAGTGLASRILSLEIPSRSGISSLSVMIEVEPTAAGRSAGLPDRLVARLAPDASGVPVFPTYDLEEQFLVLDHIARNSRVPSTACTGWSSTLNPSAFPSSSWIGSRARSLPT